MAGVIVKTMKTLFLISVTLALQVPGFLWASTTAEKKLELNGSSWDVVLMSTGDLKKNVDNDIFTFQSGQFRSKNLMNRGFADTNFAISLPTASSNLAVWETMQTGKEGVIFLHGEWAQDKMWGTVTEQLEGGRKVVDYSFVTRKHWQPEETKVKKSNTMPMQVASIKPAAPVVELRQVESNKVLHQVRLQEDQAEASADQDKFLEEIRKFERAQAQAIKPAQ